MNNKLTELRTAINTMKHKGLDMVTVWETDIDGKISYGFNFDLLEVGYTVKEKGVTRKVVFSVSKNYWTNLITIDAETDCFSFKTCGDYEIEYAELKTKFEIINKYFPFSSVIGYCDNESGINVFLNDIEIKGTFENEPFTTTILINGKEYELDFHPFGEMGGFAAHKFDERVRQIFIEENTISLVIAHDGYAVKSLIINKADVNDYKYLLVRGTQEEGKILI